MSPDLNAERLETLRQLFPDWFTQEGHLDVNEVKKAVNPDSVDETERYEFRWFGKSKAKRNAFTPTRATLHYDETRSVNADKTENCNVLRWADHIQSLPGIKETAKNLKLTFSLPYEQFVLTVEGPVDKKQAKKDKKEKVIKESITNK